MYIQFSSRVCLCDFIIILYIYLGWVGGWINTSLLYWMRTSNDLNPAIDFEWTLLNHIQTTHVTIKKINTRAWHKQKHVCKSYYKHTTVTFIKHLCSISWTLTNINNLKNKTQHLFIGSARQTAYSKALDVKKREN
jgi:hypothetical protein